MSGIFYMMYAKSTGIQNAISNQFHNLELVSCVLLNVECLKLPYKETQGGSEDSWTWNLIGKIKG